MSPWQQDCLHNERSFYNFEPVAKYLQLGSFQNQIFGKSETVKGYVCNVK